MKIGLLVTQEGYEEDIIGLTKAAVKRGHEVIIFMTDTGVMNSQNSGVVALKDLDGVSISLCDFSAKNNKLTDEMIPEGIIAGSQYQNAVMNQDADKVIVL